MCIFGSPAVNGPQDIMVLVTKFKSLGETPSLTPFRIPGAHQRLLRHESGAFAWAEVLCSCPS